MITLQIIPVFEKCESELPDSVFIDFICDGIVFILIARAGQAL